VLEDVLHLERVTKVRLVAAVFAQGLREWNPRPAAGHGLAFGEVLEHAGEDRSIAAKRRSVRQNSSRCRAGRRTGPYALNQWSVRSLDVLMELLATMVKKAVLTLCIFTIFLPNTRRGIRRPDRPFGTAADLAVEADWAR
jgi:hypothetical protein